MRDRGRFHTAMAALLAVCSIMGCGKNAIKSVWPTNSIQIDGQPLDWRSIPGNYISAPNIEYRVANDSTNLYVLLRLPRAVAARIGMHGLTLWLDPKASKQKKIGVRIPKAKVAVAPPSIGQEKPANGKQEGSRKILDANFVGFSAPLDSLANLASFTQDGKEAFPIQEKNILLSAGKYEEWLSLEISLPFEAIGIDISRLRSPRIGMGIEIPAVQPPRFQRAHEQGEEGYPQAPQLPPASGGRLPLERRFFEGLDAWVWIELALPY